MYSVFTITGTTPNAPSGGTVIGSPAVFSQVIEAPESLEVYADLVGATGGVLNLYLQSSPDEGTNWYDYAAFTQLAAAAAAVSVRFGVSRSSNGLTTPTVVGKNLPATTAGALAAGTVIGGPFHDRMRLYAIAGASTTAGATITVKLLVQSTQGVNFPRP